MIIVLPDQRSEWWAPTGSRCFSCREPAESGFFVCWIGVDGDTMLLHPRCAARLGTHLIADSREADLAGGRHPWDRRSEQAFLASLRNREVQRR